MQFTKTDRAIFCHEFGHVLTTTLLFGYEIIEGIEVISTLERIDGHTQMKLTPTLTQEEMEKLDAGRGEEMLTGYKERCEDLWKKRNDVRILFGGVVAEYICGYTKVKMHKGTDAEKIKNMIPDKLQQNQIWSEVCRLLEPCKCLLDALTDWGMEKVEWNNDGYYVWINNTELQKELKSLGLVKE